MGRKRGSRFRKAADGQEQLEEIEQAQRVARTKRTGKIIERIDKSAQRTKNSFESIGSPKDAEREFE
jgi:hypothetical protein